MKSSTSITLVLVSTLGLSACKETNDTHKKNVYLRSDTSASYTRTHSSRGYHAFVPYGTFLGNRYQRAGYYSEGIRHTSNVGSNSFKQNASRGGFGSSAFRSSSS